MLHHVHADDVAQAIELAVGNPASAIGESFNVVSPQAVTLRGLSEQVAGWYGKNAELIYLDWEEWRRHESQEDAGHTWEHIRNSPCGSIEKARHVLGYEPRYTTYEMLREALTWLIVNGRVNLPKPE